MVKLSDGLNMWQQLVARDFRFDPERYFPKGLARLHLSSSRYCLPLACGETRSRDTGV